MSLRSISANSFVTLILLAACSDEVTSSATPESSSASTDEPAPSTTEGMGSTGTGETSTTLASSTTSADVTSEGSVTTDGWAFDVGVITDAGVPAYCGDGSLDDDEECDDGNGVPNDGCEETCTVSTGLAEIHAGGWSTCARTHEGALRCWGWNSWGQLGNGTTDDVGDDETPAEVEDVPIDEPVLSAALNHYHACAIVEGGAVRCWGYNDRGQLGYGDTAQRLTPGDAFAFDEDAIAISAGTHHTCVLLEGGDVRCWGENAHGQLGLGNDENVGDDELPSSMPPIDLGAPAIDICAGEGHTCAVLEDGTLRCWGSDSFGQLGNGGLYEDVGDNELPSNALPVLLGAGEIATDVACGTDHTCAIIDGTSMRCWGYGELGELGSGMFTFGFSSPGPDIDLGDDVRSMSLGQENSCARTQSDAIFCWGNSLGYPGNMDYIGDDETPASMGSIMTGDTVIQLSGGAGHRCVILDTKSVRCWGSNSFGQLGYGHTESIGDDEDPAAAGDVPVY